MAHFSFLAARTQKVFMKAVVFSSGVFIFLIATSFTTGNGLDDIIRALQKGSASEISKYFDDTIQLTLPDKSDSYSRAQATIILQDFFNNNGVKSFDVKHKGDNGGSEFCIGTLTTRSGSYRTTVFMTNKNGKQLLKEIRFQSM